MNLNIFWLRLCQIEIPKINHRSHEVIIMWHKIRQESRSLIKRHLVSSCDSVVQRLVCNSLIVYCVYDFIKVNISSWCGSSVLRLHDERVEICKRLRTDHLCLHLWAFEEPEVVVMLAAFVSVWIDGLLAPHFLFVVGAWSLGLPDRGRLRNNVRLQNVKALTRNDSANWKLQNLHLGKMTGCAHVCVCVFVREAPRKWARLLRVRVELAVESQHV